MSTGSPEGSMILVVDDMPENHDVMRRLLTVSGFEVVSALTGEEALACVAERPPDVILLDLVMPGMGGIEVCQRLKHDDATRHIPVIIITGLTDREANIRAVEAGADDFLPKPFDAVLLQARIRTSISAKRMHDRLISYQRELENSNLTLEQRVHERTRQVELTQHVTVFSLAKLAESRDPETGDHIDRMRNYVREVARAIVQLPQYETLGSEGFVEQIYHSSPLHDVGKVGIPDRILLKPGKLTPEEFEIMKKHSTIGGDTLRAADVEAGASGFLSMACEIAYYHHEKWDGSGYPEGRGGLEIPLSARIVAIADVYDALTTRRPYKEPFSHEKSVGIISEGKGKHFDPDVVDAFLSREEQVLEIRRMCVESGTISPIQRMISALEDAKGASV